jgi:hypothetical protein
MKAGYGISAPESAWTSLRLSRGGIGHRELPISRTATNLLRQVNDSLNYVRDRELISHVAMTSTDMLCFYCFEDAPLNLTSEYK